MGNFRRLTLIEREEIAILAAQGLSIREIGKSISRHHSVISREIRKSGSTLSSYRAIEAEKAAKARAARSGKRSVLQTRPQAIKEAFLMLGNFWSPEQISIQLKIKFPKNKEMHLSLETIYKYIYLVPRGPSRDSLIAFLRHKRKLRKNRKNVHNRRGIIPNALSIRDRPKEVDLREEFGHWEGDLIMGKAHKSAIGVLVERKSRLALLVKLASAKAEDVRLAFERQFMRFPPKMRKTLTYDRGKEMSQHELLKQSTNVSVYFADPHSPWQKGSVENTNGLIRQFFPKSLDLSQFSDSTLEEVQELLNNRPRKVLGFQTPNMVFYSGWCNQN